LPRLLLLLLLLVGFRSPGVSIVQQHGCGRELGECVEEQRLVWWYAVAAVVRVVIPEFKIHVLVSE
jgi:hypothetical protein